MRLSTRNVSKTFRDASGAQVAAIRDVSFSVAPGERVALIGPSGAGKTTLLRLLNGTLMPDVGCVCYDERCLPGIAGGALVSLRREIATVYQQHYLVLSLPVYQNVLAGRLGRWSAWRALTNLVWPRREDLARAAEVLSAVSLEEKLHSRTADLSGGQQQRVAIARALVQDPGLILADEPVASLDAALAEEITRLLVALCQRERKTLVASLHDVALARRHFDRVIALHQGRVLYDGPAAELNEARLAGLYA